MFLALTTVGFLTAWFVELVPYGTEWGNVAEWVSALATAGALTTIFIQLARWRADQRSSRERETVRLKEQAEFRDREREAEATSVGAEFETLFDPNVGKDAVAWKVRNASTYPILNVRIMSRAIGEVHSIGTILPQSDRAETTAISADGRNMADAADYFVAYEDIWGGKREYPHPRSGG